MAARGATPMASRRIFNVSPGLALISVRLNFISSPAVIVIVRGACAASGDVAAASARSRTKRARYTRRSVMTAKIIASLNLALAVSLAAIVAVRASVPVQTKDRDALQKTLLAATTGDKAAGKAIFDKVCATCHKFGDAGKEIGPDLTTIASLRKRPEIIESLLWPSKVIEDKYQPTLIQTKDGDIISGLVLKENARAVTIATSDHPEAPVEVLKSKIQERAKSTTSMMPENLLDAYTPEQISGLIALLLAGPGGLQK